ncbi:unnamed protein product [Leptosia nina]|uniref:Uncharacterized protein n=1 Tax=Leptosia nina TaxID=320188 RepID=A0AAV1JQ85_9NEOP
MSCMQATVRLGVELIDRSTRYAPLHARGPYAQHTRRGNRMAHTCARAAVCARQRRISYRPARCPLVRPVAALPELRRIVTRLDMPLPAPRAAPAVAHAHRYASTSNTSILSSWRSKLPMLSALIEIFY